MDIHNRYRVLEGAIYGLASHGSFLGAFKPGNRSRQVKGLYLAGGAAGRVGMAVDAIRMASFLDVIVLVTGDGDFLPLVDPIRDSQSLVVRFPLSDTHGAKFIRT
ncbi:NYN domain-containing protein [Aurantimicrobium minutum]|uniref:NYN domain-containing protein n=1 Tax=Aurantimicrobium minutum TaxID=708131 RepID=UPI00248D5F62|nr:NYN domain-containing protein [Aurantimicrobium minutum]